MKLKFGVPSSGPFPSHSFPQMPALDGCSGPEPAKSGATDHVHAMLFTMLVVITTEGDHFLEAQNLLISVAILSYSSACLTC